MEHPIYGTYKLQTNHFYQPLRLYWNNWKRGKECYKSMKMIKRLKNLNYAR